MKKLSIIVASVVLAVSAVCAGDWAEQQKQRDRDRAAHWAARGYSFDPNYMTAWSMDQKVKDIRRGHTPFFLPT